MGRVPAEESPQMPCRPPEDIALLYGTVCVVFVACQNGMVRHPSERTTHAPLMVLRLELRGHISPTQI